MTNYADYGIKALEKYGVAAVLKAISMISWFLMPLTVWILIFQYLGESFFVTSYATFGIAISIFYFGFMGFAVASLLQSRSRLLKNVEYVREMFDKPEDQLAEENFRKHCSEFVRSFLVLPDMYFLGLLATVDKVKSTLRRIPIAVSIMFLQFFFSYSIVTCFLMYRLTLFQYWQATMLHFPYESDIVIVLTYLFNHPIGLCTVILALSAYTVAHLMKNSDTTRFTTVLCTLTNSYSIFLSIGMLITMLIMSPWTIKRKSRTLRYVPFTFPTNLIAAIQKAVKNTENKDCRVTQWSVVVENENDIVALKKTIAQQDFLPAFVREASINASSDTLLKRIAKAKPVLYLGVVENRCAIIGRAEYDTRERVYRASFEFDNPYIKKEFKSIAKIEIDEQKKLKSDLLPNDISNLLKQLGSDI